MPVRVRSSEGSGVAALAMTTARREAPPSQSHQRREACVGCREDPERRLVEDEPLEPVLNETRVVRDSTRLDAKPGLECCERAELPQPRLNYDEGNGCEMRQPEPPFVHPLPVQPVSCENHEKATHDEEHDSKVKQENCIS